MHLNLAAGHHTPQQKESPRPPKNFLGTRFSHALTHIIPNTHIIIIIVTMGKVRIEVDTSGAHRINGHDGAHGEDGKSPGFFASFVTIAGRNGEPGKRMIPLEPGSSRLSIFVRAGSIACMRIAG